MLHHACGGGNARLAYYMAERTYGQPMPFRVLRSDEATGLLAEHVGEQLVLEPVSGALLPYGAPQVLLPPALLAALVSRGVLEPIDLFCALEFDSWLRRRHKYVPETDSAVHRARAAAKVARALDDLSSGVRSRTRPLLSRLGTLHVSSAR